MSCSCSKKNSHKKVRKTIRNKLLRDYQRRKYQAYMESVVPRKL